MFLNYIKDFFVKKTLKKSFQNLKNIESVNVVKTIGLLVDATRFAETELLIQQLIANGIAPENITTIAYRDKLKKTVEQTYPVFNSGNLNWNGEISSSEVNDFVSEKFDLLISYYDIEKAILLKITHISKAQFKVGFSSIDKRLNHFMIKTDVDNYTLFVSELFKYLKILNKI
ncbi:hypothetical protein QLS31_09505 [Flavobacterium sp. XS2P24]|uniref:DUF6913 domain-containing protein n=1 Tax=Flavobacterium sp. XS2P24 TaxID=3041249 RepID=UPI0024A9CEFC|nr:hypothetical protein [Flavobacterium sp. XS2P24]MDI6050066.1 hypothetical protein [Flavobacterium sp. XS2P24]